MASGFNWLDMSQKENQVYLVGAANEMEKEIENLRKFTLICEEQKVYIKQLEKQVRLLNKTLDVVNKNRVLEREVRRRGRSPMDKNLYRYVR